MGLNESDCMVTPVKQSASNHSKRSENNKTNPKMPAFATPLIQCLALALLLPSPLILNAFARQDGLGLADRQAQNPLTQSPAGPEEAPQIPRDQWKDCFYNKTMIRCQDQQQADWLRIVWIDGVRSSFVRKPPSKGLGSYWGDRYGGRWRRDLLPQGNTLLTHQANGNRILVPLRFPCQPPLKGEVGYCRY